MPSSSYDYLIIGAGPAGLQLGYFLQKSSYLIVEGAESPGSFYASLPRHGKMISTCIQWYATLSMRSRLPSCIYQKIWRIAGFLASTLLYERLKSLAILVLKIC